MFRFLQRRRAVPGGIRFSWRSLEYSQLTSTIFYDVSSIVDQNLGIGNGFVLALFVTFARTPKSAFHSQL